MKKYLLLLPVMAIFAGCTKQEIENASDQSQSKPIILALSKAPVSQGDAGDPTMRTTINVNVNPMTTSWETNDSVALYMSNASSFQGNAGGLYEFKYTGPGEDVSTGNFVLQKVNKISSGDYMGVYPYGGGYLTNATGETMGNADIHMNMKCQIHTGTGNYDNFADNAFMYTQKFHLATDITGGFLKTSTDQNLILHNAMAFLVFNFTDMPSKLYQIEISSPNGLNRTFSVQYDGFISYINATPSVTLFADDDSGGGTTYSCNSSGNYACGMIVAPGLAPNDYVNLYLRTNDGTKDILSGIKLYFPNGIRASYFYPIKLSWNNITKSTKDHEVWKGGSAYTLPYIKGNNIIIRTPSELAWVAGVVNGGPVPFWDLRDLTVKNMAKFFGFNEMTINLANDLDMGNFPWTPIGLDNNTSTTFNGTFYGNGHNIYNLVPNQTGTTYGGLFLHVNTATKTPPYVNNLFVNGTRVAN